MLDMNHQMGIGYQEAKNLRVAEGFKKSEIESKGNESYLIYFGRAHLTDFETGIECRGPMKIGRGKFMTALMRGRNQPGIDFRVYAEIRVETNDDTHALESVAKDIFKHRNIVGNQGQRELYDFKDEELSDIVNDLVEVGQDCQNIKVKEIIFHN